MSGEPTWPTRAPDGNSLFVNLILAVTPCGSEAASPSWIACARGFAGGVGPVPRAATAIVVPPTTSMATAAQRAIRLRVDSVRRCFTALKFYRS